jgi:hypothetical protein
VCHVVVLFRVYRIGDQGSLCSLPVEGSEEGLKIAVGDDLEVPWILGMLSN